MKKKVFLVGTVLVLFAGFVLASAKAHSGHRGWGHRAWGRSPLGYVAKELELTENQKGQIQTIWQSERPTLSRLAKQFADENRDMNTLTANGTSNEAEVSRIASLQGATFAQLVLKKEHMKAAIYKDVLNPEQRAKADTLLSRWQSHIDRLGAMAQ